MSRGWTITATTACVLRAFLEDPARPRYGWDLMGQTGLKSGSLYPILSRLRSIGWIVAHREDIDPVAAGRPARRYYTMTVTGTELARGELAALSAAIAPPPRSTPTARPGWATGGAR
jgi:hypothetical protein